MFVLCRLTATTARRLLVMVVAAVVLASCSGSSAPGDEPSAAGATPTEAEVAVETPTAVAAPPVSDQDFLAAAIAELDATIAAGQGPEGAIAYDLMDSSIDDEGFVTLTVCTWTGESVFDDVRDSLYRTSVSVDGDVTATHVTSPIAAGDCINSELIESAFDFIDAYDLYSADVLANPEIFASDPRSELLLGDGYFASRSESTARWVQEDIYYEPSELPDDVRGRLEADALFRRYAFENVELLELVVCRPMNLNYGVYRDSVLIDDEGRGDGPGVQSISAYQLQVDPTSEMRWRIAGEDGLIWADCFETNDWLGAVNQWIPEDADFQVLEQ